MANVVLALMAKLGLDSSEYEKGLEDASNEAKGFGSKLVGGFKTAVKVGTAVTSSGFAVMTKQALDAYSEYEQLAGGVETLFMDSADTIKAYADEAYSKAGLSANEYLETVTNFSASLIQATGRGEQQNIEELEARLDEEYKLQKRAYEDEYKAAQDAWKEKLSQAKKNGSANYKELQKQRDEDLKSLKRNNQDKLEALKAANKEQIAAAEEANNASVTTTESLKVAADTANRAIIDMSDNANKMGTSMEAIQNAYSGFSKQNYTMLDNLKLGYGGTKSEMERLIADASKMTDIQKDLNITVDEGNLSFDNIVNAIHIMQTSLGIAGATADEAKGTIEGSLNTMKGAWSNFITGLGREDADMGDLTDKLITSAETFLQNAMPRIKKIVGRIVDAIKSALEEKFPVATSIISGFLDVVKGLFNWITDNWELVVAGIVGITTAVGVFALQSTGIAGLKAAFMGLEVVQKAVAAAQWLMNAAMNASPIGILVTILAGLVAAFITLWNTSEDFRNFWIGVWEAIKEVAGAVLEAVIGFFEGAWETIKGVWEGVTGFFGGIWDGIKGVFGAVGDWFKDKFEGAKNLAVSAWDNAKEKFEEKRKLVEAGFEAIGGWCKDTFGKAKDLAVSAWDNAKEKFAEKRELVKAGFEGIGNWFSTTFTKAKENATNAWSNVKSLFGGIWDKIKSAFNIGDALQWGKDMIDNFINGIKGMIGAVGDAVKGVADKVKSFLGFSEPEEGPLSNFHTFAPDMMQLFAKGVRDNEDMLTNTVASAFDFSDIISDATPTASVSVTGSAAGNGGQFIIPIYIGGDKVDEKIINAIDAYNYRTGGRS